VAQHDGDVVMAAMRARLVQHPQWRETALPATPATLDALLATLAVDVGDWRAIDLLAATESDEQGDKHDRV
jgi:hypothetical protein